MRKENKRSTPKSASTSSSTSTSVTKPLVEDLGLSSLEQAKLCASTALLKLFQEHESAQDFFSTSEEDTTERKLFCKWLKTIVNTNMSALIDPTIEIKKSKRQEAINVAANVICTIMSKEYNLVDLCNPKVSEQLSKLISQRRSRKKKDLLDSLKNQVTFYIILTSLILLTSIYCMCRVIYLINKMAAMMRRRRKRMNLNYHQATRSKRLLLHKYLLCLFVY